VSAAAPRPRRNERGVLIVLIMAGIAIAAILSAVAAQKWSDVIRRDNEAEMIFRAQDLVRGLKRFQKDHGRLPNTWDELKEPGQKGQYFVRQMWKDPLVKGGKWQTLYAAPQGGVVDPTMINAPGLPGAPAGTGSGTGTGASSLFGSPSDSTANPQPGITPPSPPPFGAQSSSPTGLPQGVGDIIKKDDGTSELSGLPIAGVKSRCKEKPFRVYREKSEYALWLFSVFDLDVNNAGVGGVPQPGAQGNGGVPQPGAQGNQTGIQPNPAGNAPAPVFPPR